MKVKEKWISRNSIMREGTKKIKDVFDQLLKDAGFFDKDEYRSYDVKTTNYGFRVYVGNYGGPDFEYTVVYSPETTEWVISCGSSDADEFYIDVENMGIDDEPDFETYRTAVPEQETGNGFNNLIDSLLGGSWTAFYKVDWDSREKYYI